jgi:Ni,Fe-hydrogenase maturation factor
MKQTAVEFLVDNLHYLHSTKWDDILEQAKEMEKKEKIEFACQVAEASAEKYIQGKTTWEIAKDLLTFK